MIKFNDELKANIKIRIGSPLLKQFLGDIKTKPKNTTNQTLTKSKSKGK